MPRRTLRRYTAGSLSNLYRGEPLLVVHGTTGEAKAVKAMEALARDLATHTISWGPMALSTIPVKRDTEVNETDIEQRNLVLVGGPDHNLITRKIAHGLPAQERDGRIVLTEQFAYDLAERGYVMYHYNPMAPERLVFVVASSHEDFYTLHNGVLPEVLDHELAADFVLADVASHDIVRRISWNKQWKPAARFLTSPRLPTPFANRKTIWEQIMLSIRRSTNADFAIGPRPNPGGRENSAYNVAHATWADFEARQTGWRVVSAEVTEDQLRDLQTEIQGSEEIEFLPEPADVSVTAGRRYRLAMAEWVLWSLREHQKTLDTIHVAEGGGWLEDLKRRLAVRGKHMSE